MVKWGNETFRPLHPIPEISEFPEFSTFAKRSKFLNFVNYHYIICKLQHISAFSDKFGFARAMWLKCNQNNFAKFWSIFIKIEQNIWEMTKWLICWKIIKNSSKFHQTKDLPSQHLGGEGYIGDMLEDGTIQDFEAANEYVVQSEDDDRFVLRLKTPEAHYVFRVCDKIYIDHHRNGDDYISEESDNSNQQ